MAARIARRRARLSFPPVFFDHAFDGSLSAAGKKMNWSCRFRGPSFVVTVEPGLHSRSKRSRNPAQNLKTQNIQERCRHAIHDDS